MRTVFLIVFPDALLPNLIPGELRVVDAKRMIGEHPEAAAWRS